MNVVHSRIKRFELALTEGDTINLPLGFAARLVAIRATIDGDDSGVDEVQVGTLTLNGGTGNLTLTVAGETTGNIAHNATGAQVTSAIDATAHDPGDVVVTGGAGGPWTFTFGGNLAGQSIATITADLTGITGDMPDAEFNVVTTTEGEATDWDMYVGGRQWSGAAAAVEIIDHVLGTETDGQWVDSAAINGIVTDLDLVVEAFSLGAADAVNVEVVVLAH